MISTHSFRSLIVWQKARDLAVIIYRLTDQLPKSEIYGLSSQMRRAAVSISSNIAESYNRFHAKEKNQFLNIGYASGSELESQIEIAKVLYPNIEFSEAGSLLDQVMRMLNKLVH